jgi:hypothetical protein
MKKFVGYTIYLVIFLMCLTLMNIAFNSYIYIIIDILIK